MIEILRRDALMDEVLVRLAGERGKPEAREGQGFAAG